jgi:signal transduction histidine kinase
VQLLLEDEADEERRQQLVTIGAQALRIRDMIGDLMLYARPPVPQRGPHDLAEVVRGEEPRLLEAAAPRGTALSVGAASAVPIHADRIQVCVVLHALVRNSLEALRAGGTVRIEVRPGNAAGEAGGSLIVTDDGPGLTEKDRRHLFDPFYSGRQAGRGIGFGLPKCWRIVQGHGGRIDVASRPGETTVTVWWPAS